jgi:uncharacterized Ntn-hydrolase superfamily protein
MRIGTFSIVARCEETGQLGVATSTAALAGGAFVPHARPGLGAVATQAYTNWYLAPAVFDRLSAGAGPEEALQAALAADEGREFRQLLAVDSLGRCAAHTGAQTEKWSGHLVEASFAVAGNTLTGPEVVADMAEALRRAEAGEPLGERLVRALEAGQAAGGDRRGRQSAALLVVWNDDYGHANLRVDDHPEPVVELRRLWEKFRVDLEPYIHLFPNRARPAGETNLDVWSALTRLDSETRGKNESASPPDVA